MKSNKKKELNNGLMIHFSLITRTDAPGKEKENKQLNQISFEHAEGKQVLSQKYSTHLWNFYLV